MPIGDAALDGARAEVKAWLRLETENEDAIVDALIRSAIGHGEGFTGRALIVREEVQRLPASREWQRLTMTPVSAITSVMGIPADGAGFLLPVERYAVDIDGNGDGWVRLIEPGAAGRIDVTHMAGMAADWASLPDAIRQGAVRLAAHMFAQRDGDGGAPPAAVSALWQPWRRMRIG
ncbi:head-tail connector protein [Rhizorhapis sp. SPR117]|uniref:head-tail connector protein n=1 Tax=Rhizorhapis sp. SPR117 TaxID=2912611 RepID=UPI001F38B768|nr:hypothetical protein [Rhizorhapis sp. SPR117]